MTDTWRSQAIPVETQNWREQAVPSEAPSLPVKWVGGKGGAVKYNATPQEELLSTTSVGRVLDAFGQGAEDGWGSDPLGLNPESEQVLRDVGLYSGKDDSILTAPFRAFNEALIRPAVSGVDALFRLFPTVIKSGVTGIAQIGEEVGLLDPNITNMADPRNKQRFIDSVDEFINIGGIVAMGEPAFMGTGINTAKAQKSVRALEDVVKPVEKPADMLGSVLAPGSEIKIKNPTDMVPALRLGPDEIYVGKVGEQHKDVFNRNVEEQGMAFANKMDNLEDLGAAYGFYDTVDKKFITATDALKNSSEYGINYTKPPSFGDMTSPELVRQQNLYLAEQANQPKSLGAAATPADKLAQPIPPRPEGTPAQYVKGDGVDTAKLNSTKEVYDAIEELSQANSGYAPLATRGKVTWAETEAAAQAAGVTPDVLFKRAIGDAWNSTQLEAATTVLRQTASELVEASRKARASGSDADMLAAQEAWLRASLANEAVTGLKTEAGRALNILKKSKQEAEAARVNDLGPILDKLGTRANLKDVLDAMDVLDDPAKVQKLIHDLNKAGPTDMVLEYVYNAMLSGPTTHMANIIGNSLAQLWRVAETQVAGGIGAARQALGSKSALAGDRVYMGESGAKVWGMLQGLPEGLKAAYKTIRTGDPANVSKLETRRMRKVTLPSGQKVEVPVENRKAIPGPVGTAVRVPGTLLMAEDEVFQAMAYRANLQALAYRSASKKGLKGQAFADHIAKKVNSPTKEMMEKARAEADYVTFTKELGKTGKFFQKLGEQHPILKAAFAPFIRTPINLIKFPLERTVLSVASREVFHTLSGKKGAAARDEQYAKIVLGTGITAGAYMAAAAGRLTGSGPSDPVKKQMWLLAGNQPYSFRVGDTWYSYARIEPVATLLGISADFVAINEQMTTDEAADLATLIAISASENIGNKTFIKGFTDATDAFVNDPQRYMGDYIKNLSTRFVPAIAGQVARVEDPYLRDARNIIEAYKTRLLGKSDEVYPKRDIFGNALKRDGALGPDFGSPIFTTQMTKDPVVKELYSIPGAWPAKVERQIRGVELDGAQYDDYQRISGRLTYMSLQQLFNTPGWSSIPAGIKTEVVTKTINRARENARTYMLFQHQDILKKSMELKRKHLLGE